MSSCCYGYVLSPFDLANAITTFYSYSTFSLHSLFFHPLPFLSLPSIPPSEPPQLTSPPPGWLANNTSPHYVRASASGLQIGLANIAAFIATFTYVSSDA